MEACRTNPFARWFALLALLLSCGAVSAESSSEISQAYRKAIIANDVEAVRQLIRAGHPVDPKKGEISSPLWDAAYWARPEIVRLMLDEGASPNASHTLPPLKGRSDNRKPIELPILANTLGWLYRFGPQQPKYPEHLRKNPDDWRRVAELLIERGAQVNTLFEWAGHNHYYSFLSLAAEYNDLDMAKRLIAKGADTNLPHESSFAPLFFAAKNGNVEMAKLLLEGGADMNARATILADTVVTPVNEAARNSSILAMLFLDRGANPDQFGLLFNALRRKDHALLSAVIAKGANTNRLQIGDSTDAETPLGYAAGQNDLIAVDILLTAGANPCLKDKNGRRAYDVARKYNYVEVLNLLEKRSPEQRCNTPR